MKITSMVKVAISRFIKTIAWSAPRGLQQSFWIYSYEYMFTPLQLCFLCQCVDKTKHLSGPIVEIGCAFGYTTVFLSFYQNDIKDERSYVAIDTFKGFTSQDLTYEYEVRGKAPFSHTSTTFAFNRLGWFNKTMQKHGLSRVRAIRADVNEFDFDGISDISFCILDVDLYRPTKAALEKVYDRAATGAIIIVDDCDPSNRNFEGAWHAYTEFVANKGLPEEIVLKKLGIIRKL